MTGKLLLLASVILVGALVIDPAIDAMLTGSSSGETDLASAYDVAALGVATGLAVYKARRQPSGLEEPRTAAL